MPFSAGAAETNHLADFESAVDRRQFVACICITLAGGGEAA
jgi:hypothetical protein